MFDDRDRYTAFYTEHLWMRLPEIYRTSDSDDPDKKGPLRELIERLGAQAAVVRRAIDRTREDQSIETCDDWLIPYLGDLLATNLVAGLDARAQRLDVAKTIYYRRRKGTVALLEELTANVTNWNARVVEFFRRLSRTRHQFDPAIGLDRDAAVIDGLRGTLSGTPAGGVADLRHAGAAAKTRTAFDEYSHTADFRRGRSGSGWHNIPKLGIFLWRLKSFGVANSTPVADAVCPDQFTFDPTGREIPLFARDHRDASAYGDAWVTPDEWMLPGRISTELFTRELANLYPSSVLIVDLSAAGETNMPADQVAIHPERGRYRTTMPLPPGVARCVRYHYGFSSQIGAGPFERRAATESPLPEPVPESLVSGGGNALQTALAAIGAGTATLTLGDSLTYPTVANLSGFTDVLLRADEEQRPVVRPNGGPWIFDGNGATLAIDGLLVSGADIILRGTFDTVTLACTTLDPGEEIGSGGTMPQTVDGRPLAPVTLWIEGTVARLVLRRAICGPIRTRGGGVVQTISVTDSIVQGVRTSLPGALAASHIFDPQRLLRLLRNGQDPLGTFLRGSLSAPVALALAAYDPSTVPPGGLVTQIAGELDALIAAASIYTTPRFAAVPLPLALEAEAEAGPPAGEIVRVNRLLLEAAFGPALAPAAIACVGADVSVTRSTVLGQMYAHRISASESILYDFAVAENAQEGCVRFTAFVEGSPLDQPYECVTIADRAAIFVTVRYGQPEYAQLALLADRETRSGGSIRAGAKNGSEMGAFSRELHAIKERGLRTKLDEFMPIGLTPVLVYVT